MGLCEFLLLEAGVDLLVVAAELGVGEEEDGEDLVVGVPEVLREEAGEVVEEGGEGAAGVHQFHVVIGGLELELASFNIQGESVATRPAAGPVAEVLGN